MPKMINKEEYKKMFYSLSNGDYELLTEYAGSINKIKVLHKKCGNCFYPIAREFIKGKRCPYCANNIKYTTDYVSQQIKNKSNGEYELISQYLGANKKIKIKHNKCGNVYESYFRFFTNKGCRCPICSREIQNKKKRYNQQYVASKIYEISNGEYEYVDGNYFNNKSKIMLIHKNCGNKFLSTYTRFANSNCRCPICKSSKGENKIKEILNNKNIEFVREKTFKDCKYKNVLRFDFYIPKNNLCIEYDGEFHYKPIFNKKNLNEQQKKDIIKNKYCLQNNIKLIRIPYWEFENIEEILDLLF